MQRTPLAMIACSNKARDAWFQTRSPMGLPPSECAGSRPVSPRANLTNAILSPPRAFDHMMKPLSILLLSTLLSVSAHAADQAVKSLSPDRLMIKGGVATLGLSQDWVHPKPQVERVVIVFHGRLRNAPTYLRSIERAANQSKQRSKTLLIAPQFLDERDITAHHLSDTILRWRNNAWMDGGKSVGQKQISSFVVIDHILKRLSDRKLFPNLKEIVIAGHSSGAQVVQRYAMIGGKEDVLLKKEGINLRYVVANSSSYGYFSPDRPVAVDPATCPGFDTWKYGVNKLPRSEEHTSELQSHSDLVCRLLLEKKKKNHGQFYSLKKKNNKRKLKDSDIDL